MARFMGFNLIEKIQFISLPVLVLGSLIAGIFFVHDMDIWLIAKIALVGLFTLGIPFLYWFTLRTCSSVFISKAQKSALDFPSHLMPGIKEPLGYMRATGVNYISAVSVNRFVAMSRFYSSLSNFAHTTATKEPIKARYRIDLVQTDSGGGLYPPVFVVMDTILSITMMRVRVGNSTEGYQLLTRAINAFKQRGYTIYDYIELSRVIYAHFDKCYRLNDSKIWSSYNTVYSLKRYIETFSQADNEFISLPIEEQWNSINEVGNAEITEKIMKEITYEKSTSNPHKDVIIQAVRMILEANDSPEDAPDLIFAWSEDRLSLEVTDALDLTRVMTMQWDDESKVPDEAAIINLFHRHFKDTY